MPVKVKICGVRTREIVDTAVDAGADYIGLVFFPRSPRHLELEAAQKLAGGSFGPHRDGCRHGRPRRRADRPASSSKVRPNLLQLHGNETPDRVAAIRAQLRLAHH